MTTQYHEQIHLLGEKSDITKLMLNSIVNRCKSVNVTD